MDSKVQLQKFLGKKGMSGSQINQLLLSILCLQFTKSFKICFVFKFQQNQNVLKQDIKRIIRYIQNLGYVKNVDKFIVGSTFLSSVLVSEKQTSHSNTITALQYLDNFMDDVFSLGNYESFSCDFLCSFTNLRGVVNLTVESKHQLLQC